MALTKRSADHIVYLEVKHYSLWRGLKNKEPGCDEVEVTNPRTGAVSTKYGYKFDTVSGRAVKLLKYDTGQKYSTRYFGFKLHISDGPDMFVLDMPYHSQILRRFLRVARNIDWEMPFSITIFKGKNEGGKKEGAEQTGVWFQQRGETVKPYYTKDQPHGMPAATFDDDEQKWDFKAQHRWLVDRLQTETIPDIESMAASAAPPSEPELIDNESSNGQHEEEDVPMNDFGGITDQDVPF